MNFEELKIIWDSQNREPLYAINEAALHDLVQVARSILWWGLIPAWLAAGLCVAALFHLSNMPGWAYALIVILMVASFVGVTWWQYHAIRRLYAPRRRELESLRAKLSDPNS